MQSSRRLLLYVFSAADLLSTNPTKLVPALLGPPVVMGAKFLVLAACRSLLLVLSLWFFVRSLRLVLLSVFLCSFLGVLAAISYTRCLVSFLFIMKMVLEICPRGNNKLVIIIYFIVHDNRLLSMLELY